VKQVSWDIRIPRGRLIKILSNWKDWSYLIQSYNLIYCICDHVVSIC
jgi:hypothetical protein